MYERSAAPARIIAIGLATFFPNNRGAVPCGASAITTAGRRCSSNDRRTDSAPAIEPKSCITKSERQSPSRLSDGITGGRSVHLFLQHPFVHGADRVLWSAEDFCFCSACVEERVLCDQTTDFSLDPFGAVGHLARTFSLTPFLGAVRVADRHADDGDGSMDPCDRPHAWNATPRPYDHRPVDRGS